MKKWNDLSMIERAKYIQLGVDSGITDLAQIKQAYNDNGYNKWKREIKRYKKVDPDNDPTYDYKSYYKDNTEEAWRMLEGDPKVHFTDRYKTSKHETFSNESQYSGYKNRYNPLGIKGGSWGDNTFILSEDQINNNWDTDATLEYLRNNDPGYTLYSPNGGIVIPSVQITNNYSTGGNLKKLPLLTSNTSTKTKVRKLATGGPTTYISSGITGDPPSIEQLVTPPAPYKMPSVKAERAFEQINEGISLGASDLYGKSASEDKKYYKDNFGRIYRTSAALDIDEYNTKDLTEVPYNDIRKILPKRDYIGGNNYREELLRRSPGLTKIIEDASKLYSIDKNLLTDRLCNEGIIDDFIQKYNNTDTVNQTPDFFERMLHDGDIDLYDLLGLDDIGDFVLDGTVKLLGNEQWWDTWRTNEKGRNVHTGVAATVKDAIGIMAADIAYRTKEVKKKFPNLNSEDLKTYTNAAYNLGLYHKDLNNPAFIQKKYKVKDYYKK